ncbi:MAG: NUDIX domain-containing protein [Patescibacteria group bacterium]
MKTINQISAGGIVCKKEGGQVLWLITQHSQHKGWVFPKGLVGDNHVDETMEDAALREVEEEGGVKARIVEKQPIETHYQYQWEGDLIKKTVFYFVMEYLSGDPADHDWEMIDARFATAEDVKKTLTYDSDKRAFEIILTKV